MFSGLPLRLYFLPLVLLGCSEFEDASSGSYELVPLDDYRGPVLIGDLDLDGGDEVVHLAGEPTRSNTALLIESATGVVLAQFNVSGVPVSLAHGDWDGDPGYSDIIVSYISGDSLFAQGVDIEGHKHDPIYIAHGQPRIDEDGTVYDWTADAYSHAVNESSLGGRVLITVVNATYSGTPRGVFVHRLPGGDPVAAIELGAALNRPKYVGDHDGDGFIEVLVDTGVSENGSSATGLACDGRPWVFDDLTSRVISVELSDTPCVDWHIEAQRPLTRMNAHLGRFERGGPDELIITEEFGRRVVGAESRVVRFETGRPLDGQQPRQILTRPPLRHAAALDLNTDGLKSIVALDHAGSLRTLTGSNPPNARSIRGEAVWPIPDVDGDGIDELAVDLFEGGFMVLDRDFNRLLSTDALLKNRRVTVAPGEQLHFTSRGTARVIFNPRASLERWIQWGGWSLALFGWSLFLVCFVAYSRTKRGAALLSTHTGIPEVWGRFAGHVAHDIKSPLTSLLLTINKIEAEVSADPRFARRIAPLLERAENRIDHLRRKSVQIMKQVGTAEAIPERLNLAAETRRVIEVFQANLPDDIEVSMEIGPDLLIAFDRDLLECVIENVLENAREALPEGGRIKVRAEPPAPVFTQRNGIVDATVLTVADTGIGLPRGGIGRVFEPGFSGREGGTGFGLFFVRTALEQFGGTASISSVDGAGTEVALAFPLPYE